MQVYLGSLVLSLTLVTKPQQLGAGTFLALTTTNRRHKTSSRKLSTGKISSLA
jgi:hypothetical protein